MTRAIGARSFLGGFVLHDGSRELAVRDSYWPTELVEEYYADYFHLDPWSQASLADWKPHVARDFAGIIDSATVESSRLYQEFIRPKGDDTFHTIGLAVEVPCGIGGYGFQRGRGQGQFEEGSSKLLDTMAKPLCALLVARGKTVGLERELATRNAAFDGLSDPLFVLGRDGRLHTANCEAEALLRRDGLFEIAQGVLRPRPLAQRGAWERALAEVMVTGFSACAVTGAGTHLACSLTRLPASAGRELCLVAVSRPNAAPGVQQLLMAVYALSSAEAEIAALLADGHDTAQIAELRQSSWHTVRQQLRSITQKLGCSRQAEIVARVHALPRLRPYET